MANAWHVGVGDASRRAPGRAARRRDRGGARQRRLPARLGSAHVLARSWLEREAGQRFDVDQALIWAADPRRVDVLLQQARAASTQVRGVRFVTRSGVRVLIDSAAGIVIALLVAFSLIALAPAATMLAATAAADVQRRLPAIGVQRAIGFSRARSRASTRWRAARTGALAGVVGLALGALAVRGAAGDLLDALNEQPPGWALLAPLAARAGGDRRRRGRRRGVARVARRPPARRSRCCAAPRSRGRAAAAPRRRLRGARGAAGARAPRRAAASVAVLAVSGAVVLLMLGWPRSSPRCATTPARWASATTSRRGCPPTARPRSARCPA